MSVWCEIKSRPKPCSGARLKPTAPAVGNRRVHTWSPFGGERRPQPEASEDHPKPQPDV